MDNGFKRPDDVVAKEEEPQDVEKTASGQDEKNEVTRTSTRASEPELPFSKARTVALVATVAAAPFLSVSYGRSIQRKQNKADALYRLWPFKRPSSSYPPSAKLWTYQQAGSNGSYQHTTSLLDAFWYIRDSSYLCRLTDTTPSCYGVDWPMCMADV